MGQVPLDLRDLNIYLLPEANSSLVHGIIHIVHVVHGNVLHHYKLHGVHGVYTTVVDLPHDGYFCYKTRY